MRAEPWASGHDPLSYAASVALARAQRAAGSWGLLYRSVRRAGGECVPVFRPKAVQVPVRQGAHVSLMWGRSTISGWYSKSDLHPLPG